MIVLFTDFGSADLYVGQVKAKLLQISSDTAIVDLLHDVPPYSIASGAHLLAALVSQFPLNSVFICVVDPGVGGTRDALVVQADGRWYLGPDNGLLSVLAGRATSVNFWRINWQPENISSTFHGRDLFAPIAAWIAKGEFPQDKLSIISSVQVQIPVLDLYQIIYIDHYGNAMTGIRTGQLSRDAKLEVNGILISYSRVYSEVDAGRVFWYENSIGLIEIAVNSGSAATSLSIQVGQVVAALQ